jgi:hypothetical protein
MGLFLARIPEKIQDALNARKEIYSGRATGDDRNAWLYKKIPYVNVTAYLLDDEGNVISGSGRSLSTEETRGGLSGLVIKTVKGEKKVTQGDSGFYTNPYGTINSGRNVPRPVIQSLKVDNDGDFGSLQKIELQFTCFSINQLNNLQIFFQAGAFLEGEYGWSISTTAAGSSGKFTGLIYNFGYSVNPDGSFSCTTSAYAPGINAFSIMADVTAESDESTTAKAVQQDIVSLLKAEAVAAARTVKANEIGTEAFAGYGYIIWQNQENVLEDKDLIAQGAEGTATEYYVSLERLSEVVNRIVQKAATPIGSTKSVFTPIQIVCNKTTTKGGQTKYSGTTLSANPKEIIIPGAGSVALAPEYYAGSNGRLEDATPKPKNAGIGLFFQRNATTGDPYKIKETGDLSKIMINIRYISNVFNRVGQNSSGDRAYSTNGSINKIFEIIFQNIYELTGHRIALTLASSPTNPYEILVLNIHGLSKDERASLIKGEQTGNQQMPYTFTAFTNDSICRNVTLSAQIPSEFVTVAAIQATTTLSKGNVRPPTADAGSEKNSALRRITIKNFLKTGSDGKPTTPKEIDRDKVITWTENGAILHENLYKSNFAAADVTDFKRYLREVYKYGFQGFDYQTGGSTTAPPIFNGAGIEQDGESDALLFPISFSATLDGIAGLHFGHTITTNYLPALYKKSNVAWTITKVRHEISGENWATTVDTVCRILDQEEASYTTA